MPSVSHTKPTGQGDSSELPAVHHLPLPHLTSVVTSGQWYPTRQSASLVELWGQNEPVLRHGSSDDGLGQ